MALIDSLRLNFTNNIQIDIPAYEGHLALAPVDLLGTPGRLNTLVLKQLGLDESYLPSKEELREGFSLLERKGKTSVLFIVTVGQRNSSELLAKNLEKGLRSNFSFINHKTVWIPLMAIGEGGLTEMDSFMITVNVLNHLKDEFSQRTFFHISIPNTEEGASIVRAIRKLYGDVVNDEKIPLTGTIMKLGCNWGKGARSFYPMIRERGIIICEEKNKFRIGDLVMITEGFQVRAIAKVLEEPIPVTTNESLEEPFDEFEISFLVTVLFARAEWYELPGNDQFQFQLQAGIRTLQDPKVKQHIQKLWNGRKLLKDRSINIGSDKIPFHLDDVQQHDKLDREPIADSLARLLNEEIFNDTKKANHSFMVHLQGAWGDGKSTFLRLLEKQLKAGKNKWIVIDFNAWQNQHISPPWWILLSQIYRQSFRSLKWYEKPLIWILENFRRLTMYKSMFKIIALILTLGFAYLIFFYRDAIWQLWSVFVKEENQTKFFEDKDVWEFFTTIAGALCLLFSFSKFISIPFFDSSPEDAKGFMQNASDPMEKVKGHFNLLISNLKLMGYQVAIFIDDLDRCNDQFTVGLLEGIQTLFKDRSVLYVVAGDRHWISNCFENYYEKYKTVAREPGQKLGYLFLEKAFQFSFRMPTVSSAAKEKYWNYILDPSYEAVLQGQVDSDENAKQKILKELQQKFSPSDFTQPEQIDAVISSYENQLSPVETTKLVLEFMDKTQDFKHLLRDHHLLIDNNPRGIKRLANQYNIFRNILTVERKEYNRDKLFRWLILQNKYPLYIDWLEANLRDYSAGKSPSGDLGELVEDSKWKTLMKDDQNKHGGPLTAEDISIFTGVPLQSR